MEKEDIKGEIIAEIVVEGMWGKKNISWRPDPHVNILAGINGSGKTTLLNITYEMLQGKITAKTKKTFRTAAIRFISGRAAYYPDGLKTYFLETSSKISTFDIPRKNPKGSGTATQLDIELKQIIYGDGEERMSFIKLDAINSDRILKLYQAGKSQEAKELQLQLSSFFDLINSFFTKTEKQIEYTLDKDIVFKNGSETITLDKLSAGEKQLLIILFSVYLQQKEKFVLLLDEPEISLHIEWQGKLIDTLLAINPNIQLIIVTHAPSIFGKGWGDKFVNIKDLISSNG
jgi:ABC-type cobalamin/Fe3+-siderophores transport system ATPase subunit